MTFKFIDKVGIEIEGGWNVVPPCGPVGSDGSVQVSAPFVGEIRSRPLARYETVMDYVRNNWPTATNRTCGFHVHVSLKNEFAYSLLMDKRFYDFFIARITAWATAQPIRNQNFWDRLNGLNTYCQKRFSPDIQAERTYKDGIRYAHLNFCFLQHGTLECRLFPTFKQADTAVKAVTEFLSIVEEWLENAPESIEVEAVETVVE